MYQSTGETTLTHEQDLSLGLGLLATICSSRDIRWNDTEKRHYLDFLGESETFAEHSVRSNLQGLIDSRHTKRIASEVTPDAELHNIVFSLEEEETSASSRKVDTCAPPSPTLYSLSSPTTTHVEFFSTPPRSSTIAVSSPIGTFGSIATKKDIFASDDESMSVHIRHVPERPPPSTPIRRNSCDIDSASPKRVQSFLPSEKDMGLSPLSSLMSSPLSSAFGKELESDHGLSSTRLSPSAALCGFTSHQSQLKTSMRINLQRPSDTPGRDPTAKKKRRRALPSPFTSRLIPFRNSQPGIATLSAGSPRTAKKLVVETRRRPRKQATTSKTKARARITHKRKIASDKENLQDELSAPEEKLKSSLDGLAMTGFLVETLALSRASAMIPSELLRAVLKSQPLLKEEHSEEEWLGIIRQILHGVKMFGTVKRDGLDAEDSPLEDEWFYIPENDKDQSRANLLKGLMHPKRAVTKRSKQYYFEPVGKLTRWDPESD